MIFGIVAIFYLADLFVVIANGQLGLSHHATTTNNFATTVFASTEQTIEYSHLGVGNESTEIMASEQNKEYFK